MPNLLMLGHETGVPEQLMYHVPAPEFPVHEYLGKLVETMRKAHEALQEKQWAVQTENSEEPPLYREGDWVWMVSYRRRPGQLAKLLPKFVRPYCVVEVLPNHSYRVECSGQISVQNEQRLKPYYGSPKAAGQATLLLEPALQPICRERVTRPRDLEIFVRDPEETNDTTKPPPQPQDRPIPGPTPVATKTEDFPPPAGNQEETPQIEDFQSRPDTPVSDTLERSRRDRRPLKYLADYHMGCLADSQPPSCSPNTGKNKQA